MKRLLLATALVLALSAVQSSQGMFYRPQTEKVPISRLFTNLQSRLKTNGNDFVTLYQLARLHSMAYSTNLSVVEATIDQGHPVFYSLENKAGLPRNVYFSTNRFQAKTHLTNSIATYEMALASLRKASLEEARKSDWIIIPALLGYGWVLDQAGRTNDALKAYRNALDAAWKQEIEGETDISYLVNDLAAAAKAAGGPIQSIKRERLGPGEYACQETIRYMLMLLDPVRDETEIKSLRERQIKAYTMDRWMTPLVIPLEPGLSLFQLIDSSSTATFDLDGSGQPQRWGWPSSKAALLVHDPDGSGKITSGLQLFGNVTFWMFWKDGYDALASLDDNSDGELAGDELRGLALWRDVNGNGVSDPGEVRPVGDHGIRSLSCRGETGADGVLTSPRGVVFNDGSTRTSFDWVATTSPRALIR